MRIGISDVIAHGCGCLLSSGIIFTLHQQLMRFAAAAFSDFCYLNRIPSFCPFYPLNGLTLIPIFMLLLVSARSCSVSLSFSPSLSHAWFDFTVLWLAFHLIQLFFLLFCFGFAAFAFLHHAHNIHKYLWDFKSSLKQKRNFRSINILDWGSRLRA